VSNGPDKGQPYNLRCGQVDSVEYGLVGVNLILGFGFALPVARLLSGMFEYPKRFLYYYAILVGLYFIESASVVIAMGIPVLSIGLAFVWGIIIAYRFRNHSSLRKIQKTAMIITFYSSLPAASFIVLPLFLSYNGWDILSILDGGRLGIPYIFPWPLNTILGFYSACAIGAILFKTVIAFCVVNLFMHVTKGRAVS
jgi:hypothetical protein